MFYKVLLLLSLLFISEALKHNLEIKKDSRKRFFIEGFGFEKGGSWELTVKELSLPDSGECSFVVKKTESDPTSFSEDSDDSGFCSELPDETLRRFSVKGAGTFEFNLTIGENRGFYRTDFGCCADGAISKDPSPVSFKLTLIQKNIINREDCYLPAGEIFLPTMYGALFLCWIGIFLVWVIGFICGAKKKVFGIHYLMTILVFLKLCTVFFKAIEYHFLKINGVPGGWEIIYYIFTFLKGITLFVVVALIGTGWTFLKPFLQDREKNIFLFVIPLQVIANIALVIIEERAPGYRGWFTWKDIFLLLDIVCCGAILLPIIWSIKHLRDASQADGKAATNMEKLKLFRQFYLLVVSYIYFTRIIVYLLDATIGFDYKWVCKLCYEVAAILFFCITGYKFRPVENNPYFHVDEDAQEMEQKEANTERREEN